MSSNLQITHTADLDPAILSSARTLLYVVFGDKMTEHDWEHSLGGMHALAWDEGELVGHASVIQRRLAHGGRPLRTGYVEGVAVHPEHRRRGHAAAMMDALERIIRAAYDLGALASTNEAADFYAKRGWRQWRGATYALTPEGRLRTAQDDDGVYVLETAAPLDLTADLTCNWRTGDAW
jgi:aminoglycoside 2'-N-acetyltransferase I